MKFDNIHFILNPIAGNGKSKIAWTQIEEYLKQNKIPYFVHITENVGHAKTIAEELTSVSNTSNLLICVGGDGTLGEIINGFINFDKHLLSVIPSSGSGNDFASCTNIPNTGYLDSVK
jgi:diacylglycerol kinase family enzyme